VKQRGFTLLEVMVAFAILVIAGVALFEAAGTALGLHTKARDIARATLVAESLMAESAVTNSTGDSGVRPVDGCTSRVDTKPWQTKAIGAALVEVRVQVRCGASDVLLTSVQFAKR
jgi:type II secretion system protein I